MSRGQGTLWAPTTCTNTAVIQWILLARCPDGVIYNPICLLPHPPPLPLQIGWVYVPRRVWWSDLACRQGGIWNLLNLEKLIRAWSPETIMCNPVITRPPHFLTLLIWRGKFPWLDQGWGATQDRVRTSIFSPPVRSFFLITGYCIPLKSNFILWQKDWIHK